MHDSKKIGNQGEQRAVRYLYSRGYDIRQRNWHSRYGEIDIIAYDAQRQTLAFIEVKTAQRTSFGDPLSHFTRYQQRRVGRTIQSFLIRQQYQGRYRCDVITITATKLKHYRGVELAS